MERKSIHRRGSVAVARARRREQRRRAVVMLMGFVVCASAVWSLLLPPRAISDTGPARLTSYTVQPGDTLWTYAQSITPRGGDVSVTVDRIMAINDLSGANLQVGQNIMVPVEG